MKAGWRQWYLVILLLLVFILSYFDRYILSLLVEPIKKDLHLDDGQIGLLLGPAFSLFNIAMAIPLGVLADRGSRKWLLIAGLVLWCMMTTASGFVMSFLPLLLLRFGLGFGEAVVSPCSVSMISDAFDRKDRARAISLYMAGPYLGAGLAFLVGGQLVSALHKAGTMTILGFGPFHSWQLAFLLVGVPGLIFAPLMLTVREPARSERLATSAHGSNAVRYMLDRWRGFGVVIVGSTCNFAMSTLTLWNVPLFQRVYGWDVKTIGLVTGLFYFTAGPLGTALALWTTKKIGRTPADGAYNTMLVGLAITVPMSFLYPIMPSAPLAVAAMFLAFIGKSTATAGGPAALQYITPGEMRTRAAAIFNTIITIIPMLGPWLIGLASDWLASPRSIGLALSGYVAVVGIPSLLVVTLCARRYRSLAAEMARTIGVADEAAAAEAVALSEALAS
jgi:MFS family permease